MRFVHIREDIDVKIPERATSGSAGYDLFAPEEFSIQPGAEHIVNTGLAAEIDDGWLGMIVPRSGLGFKTGMRLKNTVGIIDSDYITAENGGLIMVKLVNPSAETIIVKKDQAFAQMIFLPYGKVDNDNVTKTRTGGFGSTDKK